MMKKFSSEWWYAVSLIAFIKSRQNIKPGYYIGVGTYCYERFNKAVWNEVDKSFKQISYETELYMKEVMSKKQKENWRDYIGKYAYVIRENRITRKQVMKGRETITVNMGSPDHGRLLPSRIEYQLDGGPEWYRKAALAFTKEDLINKIDQQC